ncbi:MAG: hypothetical protein KDJ86_13140 [Bauldia sp.]|uniref:hypothetical protein n=1 Tax=Bauldia sp. TaxID=2575872 RepID=UPI001E17A147|nr:hypothetical protein [Bauldia sp.]MCB1496728.1 hypothetical protein [Bauldia sp.]
MNNPLGLGLVYAGPDIAWTIARDVFVGASKVAVYSAHNGSKLINKGDISSDELGVHIEAKEDGSVVNKAGASIFGATGVTTGMVASRDMTVVNHGEIFGKELAGVSATDVSGFNLRNDGDIFGAQAGVYTQTGHPDSQSGPTIKNAGHIHSDVYGIYAQAIPGLTATVVNKAGGVIEGEVQAIRTTPGHLALDNRGKIKGDVFSAAESDKVVNRGKIKGEVFLNGGDDVYRSKDGKAGLVHGGDGNDKLHAGGARDKFVFDTKLDAASNVDIVKHFDSAKDTVFLDLSIFAALTGPGALAASEFHKGKQAADADDHVIYDRTTGALAYDPDGNGDIAQTLFANIGKGLHLDSSAFTVVA